MMWVIALFFCGCNQKKKNVADPGEMISIKTLGLAYLEENQLEEAEAEFLKLIDLDPTLVLGYANLGVVYLNKLPSMVHLLAWLIIHALSSEALDHLLHLLPV